jgi:hypothetical protein
MKITKRQLRRIIKEEKSKLNEATRDEAFRMDVLARLDGIMYELEAEGFGPGTIVDDVKWLAKALADRLPGKHPTRTFDDSSRTFGRR